MTELLTEAEQQELFVRVDRSAAMGSVLRGLIHAVRNPLQSIVIAATSIAEDAGERADPVMTKLVGEQTAELTAVLEKLAGLAPPPATAPEPTSVHDVVAYVLDIQQYQHVGTMVTVHHDLPEDLPLVRAREPQLEHALLNVITNAMDALQHQRDGAVWLSATRRGAYVEVAVEDNGAGVADEVREQLFTPHGSTKDDPHAGLGLTVSRYLMERDGGSLAFAGEGARGGAVFVFQIPVWQETVW